MQVDNGFSKKYPSKTRRSLFPSLQINPCGARHGSGNNYSSQHGNAAAYLFHSSLFRVDSTFGIVFATDAWLPQARDCRRCSAVTWPTNLVGLWWFRNRLRYTSRSGVAQICTPEAFCLSLCKTLCSS